ncbi:MAG: SAM-dependent methyltransferase, partial [Phenylobacterium sp.]
ETFQLSWPDGRTETFHIWDYAFLYRHPGLYKQLIVDQLNCQVYQAITAVLAQSVDATTPLKVLDIACGSGLMGETLKNSGHFNIDYLAGVEISSEAIDALRREQIGVYDDSLLLGQDDVDSLGEKNINCMTLCGAANHLTLQDYQYYLSLLDKSAYVIFNLQLAADKPQRQQILQWMDSHYQLLRRQVYPHRKLSNGEIVEHEVFLYQ